MLASDQAAQDVPMTEKTSEEPARGWSASPPRDTKTSEEPVAGWTVSPRRDASPVGENRERSRSRDEPKPRAIFVRNLSDSIQASDLLPAFEKYGPVADVRL